MQIWNACLVYFWAWDWSTDVSITDSTNVVNQEQYFDVGGSSSTTNVNSDVDVGIGARRLEWIMNRDGDSDMLASFCQHEESPLLSDNWRFLINSVGQKFEGGSE